MFMKNLTVKISFIGAIICASFILANAQTTEKYTYRDLLSQQKVERDESKQTLKETLDKILARQKEEVDKVDNTYTSTYSETIIRHKTKREKIVQLQKEEREKLMPI